MVPFKDLPKKTLQIDVFDKDVGMHDDYIGKEFIFFQKKSLLDFYKKEFNN